MFGALTSLTGGGGLSSSSSSSAGGGDNTFANDFNYKSGGDNSGGTNQIVVLGVAALAIYFLLNRK